MYGDLKGKGTKYNVVPRLNPGPEKGNYQKNW